MKEKGNRSSKRIVLIRWLFAAAFIFAVAASGLFSGLMNMAGVFYLVFGTAAAALMGFTGREVAAAFRQAAGKDGDEEALARSAYFWEAAARNAWILGALGSALNFTIALGWERGGLEGVGGRMIQSFIVVLYGLVLAVVCLVPAMKLSSRREEGGLRRKADAGTGAPRFEAVRTGIPDRVIGYALFAAVLVLTVIFLIKGQPQAGPLPIDRLLLHWPAYLIVFGGAIALALFIGSGAGARAWTLGFALTGIVSLLMGLIQALFGFIHKNIGEIASAVAFIISASMLTLLGFVAVAAPLEDREVMEGRREGSSPLSRFFWIVLPLLTFIFLVLTFIMVVTPMKK
jgi:hypothetical protein